MTTTAKHRPITAAWTQLRAYPSRMVAVVLAIVLGVGFVAATLVFGSTYRAGLGAELSARYVPVDVVVTGSSNDDQQQLLQTIGAVDGVEHVESQPTAWTEFSGPAARGLLRLDTVSTDEELRWFDLASGTWPAADDQILIDEATAAANSLQIGSDATLNTYDGGTPRTVTVVGIADTGASAFSGAQNQAFGSAALIDSLVSYGGGGPIVAVAAPGVSPEQLQTAIGAAVPSGVTVMTSEATIEQNLAEITGGATVLTIVLLGFAVTAVVASGIVIANTFTILLTQRRRHIALIRCIGGSRRQVRLELLAEAGLVGAIGSLLGVGVGIGIGAVGATLAGLDAAGPVVPINPLVLTAIGGVLVTAVAAYAPVGRATKVSPLAALRPVADAAEQRRSSGLRLVFAGLLTGGGLLLLGAAVLLPSLLVAMAGGALSACGVLLLTRTYLPAVLRVVGRLGGAFGPPGRLAAANTYRNPGRAAATTAALMLGVGLIVTLQVGASSAQASLDNSFAERYPVDLSVTSSDAALPPGMADAIANTDGIAAGGTVAGVRIDSLRFVAAGSGAAGTGDGNDGWGADAGADGLDGGGLTILGVSEQAEAGLTAVPAELSDDAVIVPSYLLASGLSVGDRVIVSTATGFADFRVTAGPLARQGINGDSLVTTAAGLARVTGDARTVAVWAAVDPGADLEQVMAGVNTLIATEPDLLLGGSAPERAAVSSALGTVITLATALLAVAVIIAVVGIGNTLGLSVVERTRESALLRALGLHRRQLRSMLAVEAALLGAVGAGAGVLAGIGYGWIGTATAFGQAGESLVLDVPWEQLAIVLLLAVAAALLASVLPAGRAARATPIQALAEV